MSQQPKPAIQIRTPCPKRWEELVGDERQRFCSECSLHVHNSAQLTRQEAHSLVAQAQERVCMRIEYDPAGAPVFRETRGARLARWALGAGAALLAACHGGLGGAPKPEPAQTPAPVEPPSRMGKLAAPVEMGDVAVPPRDHVGVGEALVVPYPAPAKPK